MVTKRVTAPMSAFGALHHANFVAGRRREPVHERSSRPDLRKRTDAHVGDAILHAAVEDDFATTVTEPAPPPQAASRSSSCIWAGILQRRPKTTQTLPKVVSIRMTGSSIAARHRAHPLPRPGLVLMLVP